MSTVFCEPVSVLQLSRDTVLQLSRELAPVLQLSRDAIVQLSRELAPVVEEKARWLRGIAAKRVSLAIDMPRSSTIC